MFSPSSELHSRPHLRGTIRVLANHAATFRMTDERRAPNSSLHRTWTRPARVARDILFGGGTYAGELWPLAAERHASRLSQPLGRCPLLRVHRSDDRAARAA